MAKYCLSHSAAKDIHPIVAPISITKRPLFFFSPPSRETKKDPSQLVECVRADLIFPWSDAKSRQPRVRIMFQCKIVPDLLLDITETALYNNVVWPLSDAVEAFRIQTAVIDSGWKMEIVEAPF